MNIPDWQCLAVYYNVCVSSLMTPTTLFLWNKYNTINGMANETSSSYDDVSAIYADACSVIEAEIERIETERKKRRNNGK